MRSRPTPSIAALMSPTTTSPSSPTTGLQQRGDVAGAAGQVQHAIAAAHAADGDEVALPQAMHAERHQVVHQVIAARDRGEYLADQLLLVADRHVAETEVGGRIRSCLGLFGHRGMLQGRPRRLERKFGLIGVTGAFDGRDMGMFVLVLFGIHVAPMQVGGRRIGGHMPVGVAGGRCRFG